MAELVGVLIYLTAIVSGIVAPYFLRSEKWHLRVGISGSLILLGLVSLLSSFELISATLTWTLVGSAMGLFVWLLYVARGRERRALVNFPIFFGWFTLVNVEIFLFAYPAIILFVYISLWLAVDHSYDLSRSALRTSGKTMGRLSKAVITPFFIIGTGVRRRVGVTRTNRVLFLSYLLFEVFLLLAVPAVAMIAIDSTTGFYVTNLTLTGIILFARWKLGEAGNIE